MENFDTICGKDVAEPAFDLLMRLEKEWAERYEEEVLMCECEEEPAQYRLEDEYGNKLNLCDYCLKEVKRELSIEETSYKVSRIK